MQAGKTNTQTIGSTNITEQKLVRPQARQIEQSTGDTRVRSERVEQVVIHEKDAPWLIWALVFSAITGTIGWALPSPAELMRNWRTRKEQHNEYSPS